MDAKTIGSKIADARKEASLSQAQLAQQLFISPQAVGKWERGESVPDIITMNRLAEVLSVDLNYFSENAQSVMPVIANEHAEKPIPTVSVDAATEIAVLKVFNGSNLPGSDFSGIRARSSKFHGSALQGSDFSGADFSGSSFKASDLSEARFNGTNLTDCIISASNITQASFEKSIIVRTEINASESAGAKFIKVRLSEAKFVKIDLRKAIFEECSFENTCFKYADLSGVCLDGQTFNNVRFDHALLEHASFKNATLNNVSFRSTNVITNKYYRTIKTINFDGAKIDKLTIATLKGLGANLTNIVALP